MSGNNKEISTLKEMILDRLQNAILKQYPKIQITIYIIRTELYVTMN